MIDCCSFVEALEGRGWAHGSGVPCSTFSGPIAHLSAGGRYEASANEGLALSSAVGASIAGRRQAVFLQNSGLGNLINPLTSLAIPYSLPVMAFMSLRGWPDPSSDEPQHAQMGLSSAKILDAVGIWNATLDGTMDQFSRLFDEAIHEIENRRSAFLLVPLKSISDHAQTHAQPRSPGLPDSAAVATSVSSWADPETAIFATTGYLSRHLYGEGDRDRNFYMQGSMGHVSAIALGYSRSRPNEKVVVLDGDGAALMHLGQLSTIGASEASNLIHVIVDNGRYASTGGQATSSARTDFAAVAGACGYRTTQTVMTTDELSDALAGTEESTGPHCILIVARSYDGPPPPRPSSSLSLAEVGARFTTKGSSR